MVETRIKPSDIAFISPDQKALVKLTAYDFNIYGGLDGKVDVISSDSIVDEVNKETYYDGYRENDSIRLAERRGISAYYSRNGCLSGHYDREEKHPGLPPQTHSDGS